LLKVYVPGEAFGELALLYNAPRAATIIAKTDSILFSLDRECFNHIVKDAAAKKRQKYENLLESIELLDAMDNYERS
jgi:cAMP-dependent protein kinase regulator